MKKFDNYRSALRVLEDAGSQDLDNEFIQGGIINKFAVQFELGWKLLKALLSYEGDAAAASGSPREIIKEAYRYFDFLDEGTWLEMLRERNQLAHIYDGERARELIDRIIEGYVPEFQHVERAIEARYGEELARI